jgi:cytochrome c5
MKNSMLVGTLLACALLTACGNQDTTPNAAPTAAAPAPAVSATAENTQGKSIYGRSCALCHAAGVAGAPKPGDSADWAPRIAQGMDMLTTHAIDGFTGSKGFMPPRGGAANLTDEEVVAAIRFMVDQSR